MGHVVKELDWVTIDINTSNAHLFISQRWLYSWEVQTSTPPLSPWTYPEKRDFHQACDRVIWSVWSNRVHLDVAGSSEFARRFSGPGASVNFDINWVLKDAHWDVTVTKIPRGAFRTSSVRWASREISLDTEDHREVVKRIRPERRQYPVAHEFGHAIGHTRTILGHVSDEYSSSSAFQADTQSLMNAGGELRARHLQGILQEVNGMIPDTTFTVRNIR